MNNLEKNILEHARKEFPKECCGIVIKRNNNLEYIACENISNDPENYFEINADIWLNFLQYEIVAIVHSHPNGRHILSTYDMLNQRLYDIDWWLVHNDKIYKYRSIEPLLGRTFNYGTVDCYSLVRDCYMLSGLDLPDFDRGGEWWKDGKNVYIENLTAFGFEQVESPMLGDIVLMQVQSDVPNHAGIYIGNQYLLHHIENRLSKRDLLGGYYLKHTHSFWRLNKCYSQLDFTGILNNLDLNLS